MKLFLYRLRRALRLAFTFSRRHVWQPAAGFLSREGQRLLRLHGARLTAPYWRHRISRLRQQGWRIGPLGFSSLGRVALRLALVPALCFFVFYLAVYAGLLGSLPSRADLKARQNHTASEV